MDTGEFPTYEQDTPQRVSLGEVYRGQQRLERQFGRLANKLDDIFEQNIPHRVSNLEKQRDWFLYIVVGAVIMGVLGLLFATGSGASV